VSLEMPKLKLRSAKQISIENGVSYDTVLEAVRNKEIRTVTLGRRSLVPAGAWDEFIRRRTTEPLPQRKETINA